MQDDHHKWLKGDDKAAFYFERFQDSQNKLGMSRKTVADLLGIKEGTFKMREGNFRHLIGKEKGVKVGLGHPAQQSIIVFHELKDRDEEAHRKEVLDYLDEVRRRPAAEP